MRPVLTACAFAALAACSPPAPAKKTVPAPTAAPALEPVTAPAGLYTLDKAHSTVTFRVSHIGFSKYVAGFDDLEGRLQFDPANPAAMSVEVTIDVRSLDLPAPPAGFREEMLGDNWFDAARHPTITFRSTRVEPTGARTARVTGDLTLHGVTRPVVLEAAFNGGYPPNELDPGGARVGFSAHGSFKRSDFGMGYGVPAPGSTMGVGDTVEVGIETEFSRQAP